MDATVLLVALVEDLAPRSLKEAVAVQAPLNDVLEQMSRRIGVPSKDLREALASLQERGLIDVLQSGSETNFKVQLLGGVADDLARLARDTTDPDLAERARVQAARILSLDHGSTVTDNPRLWWGESRVGVPALVRVATPKGDIQFVDDAQVARDAKLGEILDRLQSRHVIALVGQPGVGKTHLVAQLVRHLESVPGTGIKLVWAKLTDEFDFEDLLALMRVSLDNEERVSTASIEGADYAEGMASAALQIMRNHTCLLILDSFEKTLHSETNQPTDLGFRAFLGKLLQHSSGLSRTILASWWVPVDSSDRSPTSVLLEGFSLPEAAQLLRLRDRAVVSDVVLKRIHKQTDGNPLAIEVMAGGLTPGSRSALPTIGTIRDACDRLDPDSRALLSAMAIAADAVAEEYLVHIGRRFLSMETAAVIARLDDLKNFKLLAKSTWDDGSGERVYWLHSLVRDHLLSNATLDLVELNRVAMDYWMRKAGRGGTRIAALKAALRYARRCRSSGTVIDILHERGLGQRLLREGNFAELGEGLEQILEFSTDQSLAAPDAMARRIGVSRETIGALVGLLADSYFKRGLFTEATSLVDWLIDNRLELIMHRCLKAQMMASTDEAGLAEAVALGALAAAEEQGDDVGKLEALGLLGFIYGQLGPAEKAVDAYARALALSKQQKDRSAEALTESRMGYILWVSGDVEAAGPHFRRGLAMARKGRDPYVFGLATGNMGHYYQDKRDRTDRDLQLAEGYYRRALDIHERAGVRRGQGYWYGQLGRIELAHGNAQDALAHLQRALRIHRAIGERAAMARHLWYLGLVHTEMGEVVTGEGLAMLALEEFEQTSNLVELTTRKRDLAARRDHGALEYPIEAAQFRWDSMRDDYEAFLGGANSFAAGSFLHYDGSAEYFPTQGLSYSRR